MWPWAELDHGLVEVIFSANGSRTSLLSARVRRQAHYSSILPLQASGIICHNRVWHDRTTECIKILLASQASPRLQCVLQAVGLMGSPRALTSCTEVLWWRVGVGEGSLSRGGSPLALRKKPGEEFWDASLQACGHPDRQATGCLIRITRGWPQCLLQSAISLLDLNPQGRLGNSSFSRRTQGMHKSC